jgi:ATP-dependent helicase/nuclease subunit A
MNFTRQQQEAIEAVGENVIVSAGAGSGKTAVLTARVIYLIKEKAFTLDQFIILTFTRLAAGEMKERIRKALTKEAIAVKESSAKETDPEKKKSLEAMYQRLNDGALSVDRCVITTFDAYALSLVKKYHFLLNVSPDIAIVDDGILAVRKRTMISAIFEEAYQAKDPVLEAFTKTYCFKNDDLLEDLCLEMSEKATLESDSEAYLDSFADTYYCQSFEEKVSAYLTAKVMEQRDELAKAIKDLPQIPSSSKKNAPTIQEAAEDVFQDFLSAQTYDELMSGWPKGKRVNVPKGMSAEEEAMVDSFRGCRYNVNKFLKPLPPSEASWRKRHQEDKPYAEFLVKATKELNRRLAAYEAKYQVYQFEDIAKMALSLVKKNPAVRAEIQANLKTIMIDEYQDTSFLQDDFIATIGNNNVYMVGDIKQSIYRFRNARCDLFQAKYDAYKNHQGGRAIDLNTNFRSRKEVLTDINSIFKNLMTKEVGGADYREGHLICFGNKAYDVADDPSLNHHADVLVYGSGSPKGSLKAADRPEAEATVIVKDIISKINSHYPVMDFKDGKPVLRPCRYSDFCLLMDRGSAFDTYAKVFNQHHVPLYVENDDNIRENDVVKVCTSLLVMLKAIQNKDFESPDFIHAFLSLGRSFLYGYSDEKLLSISKAKAYHSDPLVTQLEDLMKTNPDIPPYELFKKAVFAIGMYSRFLALGDVETNERYLDTFLGMFEQMSHLDYTLDDFILYLKYVNQYQLKITLSATGSDVDSVRLMNIHKSKGLEFAIIYFSGLNKAFNEEDLKMSHGISKTCGLFLPIPKMKNPLQMMNKDEEMALDISEKIRLFYVELTRTKEKLIFVTENESLAANLGDEQITQAMKAVLATCDPTQARPILLVCHWFDLYLNHQINCTTFEQLCKIIGFTLPNTFLEATFPAKQKFTFKQLRDDMEKQGLEIPHDCKPVRLPEEDTGKSDKSLTEKEFRSGMLGELISYSAFIDQYLLLDSLLGYHLSDKGRAALDTLTDEDQNPDPDTRQQLIQDLDDGFTGTPVTGFPPQNLAAWIFGVLNQNYHAKKISADQLMGLLDTVVPAMPFADWALTVLAFETNTKKLGLGMTKALISLTGYSLSETGKEFAEAEAEEPVSKETIAATEMLGYQNALDLVHDPSLHPFKTLYEQYLSAGLSFADLKLSYQAFGYEFVPDFLALTEAEKKAIPAKDILPYLCAFGTPVPDEQKLKDQSLDDFFEPFLMNEDFNHRYADPETLGPDPIVAEKPAPQQSLNVHTLTLAKPETVEIHRASKKLSLLSDRKALDFGTRMHFVMEVTDFKNPDYAAIPAEYQSIVKRFLATPLMADVANAKIYKEYPFVDSEKGTQGVLDLLLVYADKIVVIDYKTKHLDDEAYDQQVKVYLDFASRAFAKPATGYLYSLLDGTTRKIEA